MEPYPLDELKRWFDAYTGRLFGPDDYVNRHLRLKQEHTRRTCDEMLYLAGRLALDDNDRRIAEAVALLHDVGRFPQFATYRTYNDLKSVDHGRLGVEVLDREGVLEPLLSQEREWIRTAVAHHNQKALPAGLNGRALLFLKLIRDADKLDIYRVVIDIYRRHREGREKSSFAIELSDEPWVSPAVVEAVLAGQLVEYRALHTLNDIRLCQIGWVYDMNFTASVERLKASGFLEELIGHLPQTREVAQVREAILRYIDSRLSAR
jgi:hypothetical protein